MNNRSVLITSALVILLIGAAIGYGTAKSHRSGLAITDVRQITRYENFDRGSMTFFKATDTCVYVAWTPHGLAEPIFYAIPLDMVYDFGPNTTSFYILTAGGPGEKIDRYFQAVNRKVH